MRERLIEPALPARSLLLIPRLVVRESCGAYRAKCVETPFGISGGGGASGESSQNG